MKYRGSFVLSELVCMFCVFFFFYHFPLSFSHGVRQTYSVALEVLSGWNLSLVTHLLSAKDFQSVTNSSASEETVPVICKK